MSQKKTNNEIEQALANLRHEYEEGDRLSSRNLYGKRIGRPLKEAAKKRLETMMPEMAFDVSAPPSADQANWLEIGFGAGEHLAWQAKQNPDARLIGVEFFANGVAKALEHIETNDLKNVSIHHGDARDVLDVLKPNSLERVFILHPDPWPKRRHWERRIIQVELLHRLIGHMKPGAELRIATDHFTYLNWILRIMQQVPQFVWQVKSSDDWRLRRDDWPQTRYEAKGIREGRPATYLSYRLES